MKDYRAYLLKPDGHVWQRFDLVCDDDDDAKVRAQQLVDGHDVELWHRDQKIATFKTASKDAFVRRTTPHPPE